MTRLRHFRQSGLPRALLDGAVASSPLIARPAIDIDVELVSPRDIHPAAPALYFLRDDSPGLSRWLAAIIVVTPQWNDSRH
jgi:hypothetical protein